MTPQRMLSLPQALCASSLVRGSFVFWTKSAAAGNAGTQKNGDPYGQTIRLAQPRSLRANDPPRATAHPTAKRRSKGNSNPSGAASPHHLPSRLPPTVCHHAVLKKSSALCNTLFTLPMADSSSKCPNRHDNTERSAIAWSCAAISEKSRFRSSVFTRMGFPLIRQVQSG